MRQQCRGRHDLTRLAITALRHVERFPRLLKRVAAVGRKAFDRDDGCARHIRNRRLARPDRAAAQVPCKRRTDRCRTRAFVPARLRTSRRTQSSGMSAGASTVVDFPLRVNVTAIGGL